MPKHIIVVDEKPDFLKESQNYSIIDVHQYINLDIASLNDKRIRIINLCYDCSYLTSGYYVSLLAEARGQRVIPSANVILDLNWKRLYQNLLPEINEILNKVEFENKTKKNFYIFLGQTEDSKLKYLARKIFDEFRNPILLVKISYDKNAWEIDDIESVAINNLNYNQQQQFIKVLSSYTGNYWEHPKSKKIYKYSLAILFDPEEKMPPSNLKTINKFIKNGEDLDIDIEVIGKKDYSRISEFDALFIRRTTAVDHYTYRFAKKAESEGIVVIDDSKSIIRCANKVYLAELMEVNKIRTPKTIIFDKIQFKKLKDELTFPTVLKIPDGSFSRGVYKAEDKKAFIKLCEKLFKDSDIILAQEFMQTIFDWRVGIINNKPIYVCKYFMAKDHWQIIKNSNSNKPITGNIISMAVEDAPKEVLNTALKAAKLIGDGFYGVDLKQTEKGIYVIEVNDNPSIDAGDEDVILKDELYKIILSEFIRRIEL